jgi:hypothetical protein
MMLPMTTPEIPMLMVKEMESATLTTAIITQHAA